MSIAPARRGILRSLGLSCLVAGLAGPMMASSSMAAPGPTPVVITNGPVATFAAPVQPFAANVYININTGTNSGSDNGNLAGTQTAAVPAGKRLVVQTMSVYRNASAPNGSSLQVFLNAVTNGALAAWSLPPVVANGTLFTGSTAAVTFYVDGGTNFLVNAFRNVTTGGEPLVFSLTGYLVDMP